MVIIGNIIDAVIKEKCEQLIKYNETSYEIGEISGVLSPVSFSFGEFKKEEENIRRASEYSALIDYYQFQICRFCNGLKNDDEEKNKYFKLRAAALKILSTWNATLITFRLDPDRQQDELLEMIQKMQDYMLLLNREIMPNINSSTSKKPSKGELPIDPGIVSKALDITGIDEQNLNELLHYVK